VFQFYNLLPVFTALENVEYPLLLLGIPKKERRERSFALLEEMGIGELKNRLPREMSGGQQQRVSVARALVSNPKVVLADEPTANLDWESADRLLDIMETMCEKKKVTFLFSTHDQRVMKRAKRLIKLRDGQIQRME
jgi:putative ABC transport system ATP-binding protein